MAGILAEVILRDPPRLVHAAPFRPSVYEYTRVIPSRRSFSGGVDQRWELCSQREQMTWGNARSP
jgi:hypothetical protein